MQDFLPHTVICHVNNKGKAETSMIATFLRKLLKIHFQELYNALYKITVSLDCSFILFCFKNYFVLDMIYSSGKGSGRS